MVVDYGWICTFFTIGTKYGMRSFMGLDWFIIINYVLLNLVALGGIRSCLLRNDLGDSWDSIVDFI
jgi:hypothetical protein